MELVRTFMPTVLVFLAFVGTLGAYTALAIQGSDPGPVDELAIALGGAIAGIAAPTLVSERTTTTRAR